MGRKYEVGGQLEKYPHFRNNMKMDGNFKTYHGHNLLQYTAT